MEQKKNNNKKVIVILILIIIILSILVVLLATEAISFKSNVLDGDGEVNSNDITENDNNKDIIQNSSDSYEDENNEYIIFKADNENKSNQCININTKNYYSYEKSYVILVENINIKNNNYAFRYAVDMNDLTVKIFLNDNVIFDGIKSELLLVDVCNYGNYIIYSVGWEGSPYYTIVDTDGKIIMSFKGRNVTYSDGLLYVEEIDRNDISNFDDNELIKYQLDMNSDNLEKLNSSVEKFECDLNGPGYDC